VRHLASESDVEFRDAFEAFRVPPEAFDHRAHVRLAYVYLCGATVDGAHAAMRAALLALLDHLGVDTDKYSETITRAWILAVRHFMESSPPCASADEFVERNPVLLDSGIMLSHYSAEVLFSPEARGGFVEPDVDPIPRHE